LVKFFQICSCRWLVKWWEIWFWCYKFTCRRVCKY